MSDFSPDKMMCSLGRTLHTYLPSPYTSGLSANNRNSKYCMTFVIFQMVVARSPTVRNNVR